MQILLEKGLEKKRNLKCRFLKIPSLIFGFFSIYELLISYRKASKCAKPLRIKVDVNSYLTSVNCMNINVCLCF